MLEKCENKLLQAILPRKYQGSEFTRIEYNVDVITDYEEHFTLAGYTFLCTNPSTRSLKFFLEGEQFLNHV